jgi:hypothetical protein
MSRADDREAAASAAASDTALADEDALYTKLEKLGCRSWKDLRWVLWDIGIVLDPNEPASRAHLRAALDHLKRRKEKPRGQVL